jgi:hypothetical protein
MKRPLKYIQILGILSFILLYARTGFSQKSNYAIFIFESATGKEADRLREQPSFLVYDSMRIKINDTWLNKKDKKYYVKVNKSGLDSVKNYYRSFPPEIAITKLKAGETYTIKYVHPLYYEIIPLNHIDTTGYIRIITSNRPKIKLGLSIELLATEIIDTLETDTTEYYNVTQYDYSPFEPDYCKICISDDWFDIDDGPCIKLQFQFMGGENYSIFYDYITRNVKVKLDGYCNRKDNATRFEVLHERKE